MASANTEAPLRKLSEGGVEDFCCNNQNNHKTMEKIKFNSSFGNFPQFIGLAIIRGSGDRLIQQVMGNEKSHGICHFQNYLNGKSKVQRVSSPAESASYGVWQVPWDLPF